MPSGVTKTFNVSQQVIHNSSYLSAPKIRYKKGGDISVFLIEKLNTETGDVDEFLELGGTNLPHQPFLAPVRQQISKYYYPGGPNDRNAITQVLGTIEDDVVLQGRFKSSKIYNSALRDNPLVISQIIERFVREGNPCRFQLGHWIRYGFIVESMPKYRTNADIEWQIRIMVTGNRNPITGEGDNSTSEQADQIIVSDQVQDITSQVEKFEQLIQEKVEEDLKGVIPPVAIEDFSISGYLLGLVNKTPVGNIVEVGKSLYSNWVDTMQVVNKVESEVEEFVNDIDRTSQKISAMLLFLEVQRGKIYRYQNKVFSSYQYVLNSFNTFIKLESWRNIGTVGSVQNEIQQRIKETEDAIRISQLQSIKTTYVVKEGDTWQKISSKFFRDYSRWEDIKDLNPNSKDVFGDPVKNSVILIPN